MHAEMNDPVEGTTVDGAPGAVRETPGEEGAGIPEPGLYTISGQATAMRSTGINAEARNPIDPSSPNLSPA